MPSLRVTMSDMNERRRQAILASLAESEVDETPDKPKRKAVRPRKATAPKRETRERTPQHKTR